MVMVKPTSAISASCFPPGAQNAEHLTPRISEPLSAALGPPFFGRFSKDHLDLTVKMADLHAMCRHNSWEKFMFNMNRIQFAFCLIVLGRTRHRFATWCVACQWNELLLESIRNDFARPTVHVGNLFHTSAAMWDAWSCLEDGPAPWLFNELQRDWRFESSRETAISHAAFSLLFYRFAQSPGRVTRCRRLMKIRHPLGLTQPMTC